MKASNKLLTPNIHMYMYTLRIGNILRNVINSNEIEAVSLTQRNKDNS